MWGRCVCVVDVCWPYHLEAIDRCARGKRTWVLGAWCSRYAVFRLCPWMTNACAALSRRAACRDFCLTWRASRDASGSWCLPMMVHFRIVSVRFVNTRVCSVLFCSVPFCSVLFCWCVRFFYLFVCYKIYQSIYLLMKSSFIIAARLICLLCSIFSWTIPVIYWCIYIVTFYNEACRIITHIWWTTDKHILFI